MNGAAGPDSPEIYRGCGWAPDTRAPRAFRRSAGQTRLGCNSLGTVMSATGRAWLQLARSLGDSGATAPLSRLRRCGLAAPSVTGSGLRPRASRMTGPQTQCATHASSGRCCAGQGGVAPAGQCVLLAGVSFRMQVLAEAFVCNRRSSASHSPDRADGPRRRQRMFPTGAASKCSSAAGVCAALVVDTPPEDRSSPGRRTGTVSSARRTGHQSAITRSSGRCNRSDLAGDRGRGAGP